MQACEHKRRQICPIRASLVLLYDTCLKDAAIKKHWNWFPIWGLNCRPLLSLFPSAPFCGLAAKWNSWSYLDHCFLFRCFSYVCYQIHDCVGRSCCRSLWPVTCTLCVYVCVCLCLCVLFRWPWLRWLYLVSQITAAVFLPMCVYVKAAWLSCDLKPKPSCSSIWFPYSFNPTPLCF